MIRRIEPKHARAIRWFHWINVPLISKTTGDKKGKN